MWAPFCVSFSQQKKKMPNAFAAVTIVARYFLLFLRLFKKKNKTQIQCMCVRVPFSARKIRSSRAHYPVGGVAINDVGKSATNEISSDFLPPPDPPENNHFRVGQNAQQSLSQSALFPCRPPETSEYDWRRSIKRPCTRITFQFPKWHPLCTSQRRAIDIYEMTSSRKWAPCVRPPKIHFNVRAPDWLAQCRNMDHPPNKITF